MNAIIFSAVWGIVMMFCSFLLSNKTAFRHLASVGLLLLLLVNVMETNGINIFDVNSAGMLAYSRFGLFFNSIVFGSTLIYVLLTGKDIERLGGYVAEYFVLIFFVLCGIAVLSSYNNLLMLFL